MERNDFLEKVKRNWKKILILGAASYIALTLISTAVGAAFITKRGKQIENCEDEIGQEFQARKADFLERYYDNWDKGLKKMEEGFARTHKISDKDQIKGMKRVMERHSQEIETLSRDSSNQTYIEKLKEQLPKQKENLAIIQAAFDKKWTPQKENESMKEYERRKDEAEVDWYAIQLSRTIDSLEWYPNQREEILEDIENEKDSLNKAQDNFEKKYSKPCERTEFKELCAVLQEQARKETQEFLASVAEAEEEAAQRDDLFQRMQKRDSLVRKERETQRFPDKKPFLKMRELQKMLALYVEYNDSIAAFEEKWGIEAEGPLRELKAEHDKKDSWRRVDWGDAPVDYLAKAADLRVRLPEMEKDFDTQFIATLKERITKHEKEIQINQSALKRSSYRNIRLSLEEKIADTKADFEELKIESSLSSMEQAFANKWTPQKEAETLEQFEKRRAEGNIQFLSALIKRYEIDRGLKRNRDLWEAKYAAEQLLSQAEAAFSKTYGIACQQANIVNIATN